MLVSLSFTYRTRSNFEEIGSIAFRMVTREIDERERRILVRLFAEHFLNVVALVHRFVLESDQFSFEYCHGHGILASHETNADFLRLQQVLHFIEQTKVQMSTHATKKELAGGSFRRLEH